LHARGEEGFSHGQKTRKPKRYQYEGMLIEQGMTGWHVLDWDYEESIYRATFRTEFEAREFVLRQ
jgi:hypothetical protein